MDVANAMQQASVKLRSNLAEGNSIASPTSSQPFTIDPVLGSYFDIESPDAQIQSQVETIQEFLKEQQSTDAVKDLFSIEKQLGEASPGTRLERLYRYAKLRMQSRKLSRQAEAMMR